MQATEAILAGYKACCYNLIEPQGFQKKSLFCEFGINSSDAASIYHGFWFQNYVVFRSK